MSSLNLLKWYFSVGLFVGFLGFVVASKKDRRSPIPFLMLVTFWPLFLFLGLIDNLGGDRHE